LVPAVKEEIERMPIEIDIMENEWLAEIFHQGEEKGLVRGRSEAARHMLAKLLEKRFGPIPAELALRIESADLETLERWSLRLMDARTASETFD
jgi:predicted transposase YdaD